MAHSTPTKVCRSEKHDRDPSEEVSLVQIKNRDRTGKKFGSGGTNDCLSRERPEAYVCQWRTPHLRRSADPKNMIATHRRRSLWCKSKIATEPGKNLGRAGPMIAYLERDLKRTFANGALHTYEGLPIRKT